MERKKNLKTKERIIGAANAIFSTRGFRNATIAQICQAAGANVASVNYYFRDKENLYREVWRAAFQKSISIYPPDGGVPPGESAEMRLQGRIRALIHRIIDPKCIEFDLVQKELANPTGLLTEVMDSCLEPIRKDMSDVIRELLGNAAGSTDVNLCRWSIMSQCFNPTVRHRRLFNCSISPDEPGRRQSQIDFEELANHIIAFSLAGIKSIRKRLESQQKPQDTAHESE